MYLLFAFIEFNGQINLLSSFNESSCLLLNGNSVEPAFSPNKLICYDLKKLKSINEVEFNDRLVNFKSLDKFIFISFLNEMKIFTLNNNYDIQLFQKFSTYLNDFGCFDVNIVGDLLLLVTLGNKLGHIQVFKFSLKFIDKQKSFKSSLFKAHSNKISSICISNDQTKFCTTSIKGTIIRIWDSNTNQCLNQFRRGNDFALIKQDSINWCKDNIHLALISDKGTLHIFNTLVNTDNSYVNNDNVKLLTNYFNKNNKSLITYHIKPLIKNALNSPFKPTSQSNFKFLNKFEEFFLCWLDLETLIVVTNLGRYFKFNYLDNNQLNLAEFKNWSNYL